MDNRKIKTNDVIEFLYKAEINWVIINPNGTPVCWPDGNVKVYSCVEDLLHDKTEDQTIMTEFAFVEQALDLGCNFQEYLDTIKASLA